MEELKKESDTPIDKKDIARIQQMSGKQLVHLEARHLMRLTHDFDESYARLIVEKGNNPTEQGLLLTALKEAFEEIHQVGWWNNEPEYDKDTPSYFAEWDYQIALDGSIAKDDTVVLSEAIAPAATLNDMLAEEGALTQWLNQADSRLKASQNETKKNAESILSQIQAMRDGSLSRMKRKLEAMQGKLTEAEAKSAALQADLDDMLRWREEWKQWREMVMEAYDPADIAEVGGVDDIDLMREAIETVMDARQKEKKLEEENEQLRRSQEQWRESKEYLEEKKKWESAKSQSIALEEIKKKLMAHAYTYTDGTELKTFVLNFNQTLSGTMWMNYASAVYQEVMAAFNEKHTTVIRPEKMEVETLNAQEVNDVHNNDNVYLNKDGSKG